MSENPFIQRPGETKEEYDKRQMKCPRCDMPVSLIHRFRAILKVCSICDITLDSVRLNDNEHESDASIEARLEILKSWGL